MGNVVMDKGLGTTAYYVTLPATSDALAATLLNATATTYNLESDTNLRTRTTLADVTRTLGSVSLSNSTGPFTDSTNSMTAADVGKLVSANAAGWTAGTTIASAPTAGTFTTSNAWTGGSVSQTVWVGSVKCTSTNYDTSRTLTAITHGTKVIDLSGGSTVSTTSGLETGKAVTGIATGGTPAYVGTVISTTQFYLSSSPTSQVDLVTSSNTSPGTTTIGIHSRAWLSNITTTLTSHTFSVDSDDIFFPNVGGGTNNAIGKLLISYDPDTTTNSNDSSHIPLTAHDFSVTPDGTSITATVSTFYTAS